MAMKVARHLVQEAIRETSGLVSIQAVGLIEILLRGNVAKNHVCLKAKRIMKYHPNRSLCSIIPNFGKVDMDISKYQKFGSPKCAPADSSH